ncbi:hypothetical protein V6N13_013300 [Hibiscus sabdariffa]|uniref:Tryptophan synthase beta chain-like PALP domain-containing protein n=1 Tax=Hibiscus sabdariffa TaxID=183260 RepID=A0ABR2SHM9_9ROSI
MQKVPAGRLTHGKIHPPKLPTLEQTCGNLDAFVAAAGTGGTVALAFRSFSSFLMKNDGLFLGSSSATNCVGAVRVAKALGPGHTTVTILCDSGMRHLSKFYYAKYLSQHGLTPTASGQSL